jgi:hypothetical protein
MRTRGQASSEVKKGVREAQELEGSKSKQGMGLIVVQPKTFHFDGGGGWQGIAQFGCQQCHCQAYMPRCACFCCNGATDL